MRIARWQGWALLLSAVASYPSGAAAQAPASPAPRPTTIGSHQIDRFEAIRQLQADLRSDPNSLANWVILGELSHEVALDVPDGQDDVYYRMSREAYEKALQLDPNNNGLKAAVQFARDQ
jgi:cytochrome c-type biogenesis protein CcmH/NrfG